MAQVADGYKALESVIFRSRYRCIKDIGKGSFGEALLVRSKTNGKRYVAKVIDSTSMTEKEKRDVQNEIRILAAINHPNIIRYNEHFEDNTLIFIIMEYADGGDLSTRMKEAKRQEQPKPFSPDLAMFWFLQICMALKYLHDNHILHRDLKAANVFLTSKDVVKLGDFGISTVLQNTMACARTVCGTPYYFSPELCQSKPYNNKSDVWALGVILYETLTLQRPFSGRTLKELLKKILSGTYDPIPSTVPSEVRALCCSLLQTSPAQRPSINRILEGEYVQRVLQNISANLEHQAELERKEYERRCNDASAAKTQQEQKSASAVEKTLDQPKLQLSEREQMAMLRGMNRQSMREMITKQPAGPTAEAAQKTEVAHPDVDEDGDAIVQKEAIVRQTKDIVGKKTLGGHPEEFGDGYSDLTPQVETIALANGTIIPANEARAILVKELGREMLDNAMELFNHQTMSGMSNVEIQQKLCEFLGPKFDHNANAITKLSLWESKQKAADVS
ncbi:unnamed protein product [Phytomonas sp. EM1]|nr:unnamed protein product [Phytomonas sp. EM1]|eukprot:CCW59745.1 unnamed protein product [Phytomonas sp. isolate EM1]